MAKAAKKKPAKRAAPKQSSSKEKRWVALLRGVNVGGRNSLKMPDLAAMFVRAGCTSVKTFIQSGNVVFSAPSIDGLAERIERDIEKIAKFSSPVVIRSASALRKVLDGGPFQDPGGEKPALHVLFLKDTAAAVAVKGLDPERSPGDRFLVRGAEIYLLCPNGLADTKLTNAYFDSKLRTTSTGRNFRTLRSLLELCESG
jgi:uncharacterized protein (DUF1697 family)